MTLRAKRSRRRCWFWVLAVLTTFSCRRTEPTTEREAPADTSPPAELPPLEVRSSNKNLLLTWIDEQGDFHVVNRPPDVPQAARKRVRVVSRETEAGTGDLVYVADLRKPRADGTFPVETMTRAAWDELGAGRRAARLEAHSPSAVASGSSAPVAVPSTGVAAERASEITAVIYGAEWCRPCHDAARYLAQRDIKVVEKDIEADPTAQRELQKKLRRAGLPATASIPIIDVMGRLLVGFNPRALDRAVQQASGSAPP